MPDIRRALALRAGLFGIVLMGLSHAPRCVAAEAKPFQPVTPKEQAVVITEGHRDYSITMGGTVDMDHATTHDDNAFSVAFQPMVAVTVENTGDTPIVNPRVVSNGERRWWNLEEIVKDFTAGAPTNVEKAAMIRWRLNANTYHDYPLFGAAAMARDEKKHLINIFGHFLPETTDPVKHLNVYGCNICGGRGEAAMALYRAAGFSAANGGKDPHGIGFHGHEMSEPWVDGAYRFLDVDQVQVLLDRENENYLSHADGVRDHQLVMREGSMGQEFRPDLFAEVAALFGSDDQYYDDPHSGGDALNLTLRPGEKVIYRWDNIGKLASDGSAVGVYRLKALTLRYFGNSRHVFTPRLTPAGFRAASFDEKDIVAEGGRLAGRSPEAYVIYRVAWPYLICGGNVSARLEGAAPGDRFSVATSLDGKCWQEVWTETGQGTKECRASLDPLWKPEQHPPIYEYYVKVGLSSAQPYAGNSPGSAKLAALTMETDFLCAPMSLPRLRLGENKIEYTDENTAPREVKVTYQWIETQKSVLRPPVSPVFPEPDATVRKSTIEFAWPAAAGAQDYYIQVGKYPDMRMAFRTYYDVIVKEPKHGSPTPGMFSPDTDYYWRVRARGEDGVWSDWSPVWHFRWEGPRVPVNVRQETSGREVKIRWDPNPRGPRPAAYDVYGSDERGFTPAKEPHKFPLRPERISPKLLEDLPALEAPNFLGRTTATEMTVVGADPKLPDKSYYRVVAIDANGVESGCSDYVELPHPFVYSAPAPAAKVGRPYRYEVKTLKGLGDLQWRDGFIGYDYFAESYYAEKEGYAVSLVQAPAWLTLDRAAGALIGTPGPGDAGEAKVELRVTRTYPRESIRPEFTKTAPQFQAEDRQAFRITVTP